MINPRQTANLALSRMLGVIVAVAFGVYPAAAQKAYSAGASVLFVILTTTFLRALSLALFAHLRGQTLLPRRGELRWMLSGGFFQACSIFGIIYSLKFIAGPVMITILFTHTLMLLLFMSFRGEIRLDSLNISTSLLALLGISFVVQVWGTPVDIRGVVLVVLAAFATASRFYVFGRQVKQHNPALVGARIFSSAFVLLTVLCFFEPIILPVDLQGHLWTLLAAASLCLGTFGTFYGISLLGSFQFSLMTKIEPVATSVFSFWFLGEALAPMQYFGILLVVGSLIGYQVLQKQP